jgi:hypothetical protein
LWFTCRRLRPADTSKALIHKQGRRRGWAWAAVSNSGASWEMGQSAWDAMRAWRAVAGSRRGLIAGR